MRKGNLLVSQGQLLPLAVFRHDLLRHALGFPKRSNRGLFYTALLRYYSYKYDLQILPNTRMRRELYIDHLGTLVGDRYI